MIKRIKTYLIENYPNLWHIRLPFLLLTGLLMHVFAFLYGFIYVNTTVLTDNHYSRFSESSYFLFFEIILLLVILFGWALQFYKNSVLKHYYKAGKFYTVKLFLLLTVLFLWNISSFISFDVGINVKRNSIIRKYDVEKLIQEKEFLAPLLLSGIGSYELSENKFIQENNIHYKILDKEDPYQELRYCTEESYSEQALETIRRYDCFTNYSDIDSGYYSKVDGSDVVFFQLKHILLSEDCYPKEVISQFLKLDGYHWNEFRNHTYYSKELERLLETENYTVLANRLSDFKEHLNSVYNFTNFNPWVNLSYIVAKNEQNLKHICRNIYRNNYYQQKDDLPFEKIDTIDSTISLSLLEDDEKNIFYFQAHRFEYFERNIQRESNYYNMLIIVLITSASLAYFLIQFQFINFLNFAIAVPIAGVFVVFGAFFTFMLHHGMEEYGLILYLILLLIATSIFFWKSGRLKERVKEILMLFLAVLIPLTILVAYGTIGMTLYEKEYFTDSCNDSLSVYQQFEAPPYYEWHFIVLGMFSIGLYLLMVKRLKSKRE